MKRKLINSQLSNYSSYLMYQRQLLTLAENVFEFKNMPKYIDTAYLNKQLLRKGSIAFFVDEVLGLLALPWISQGKLDVYSRPTAIQVFGQNGYSRVIKNTDDFVIMWDNNGRYPLYLDLLQYAERLAYATRTIDINIAQQKTPRLFKCKTNNEKTLSDLINNVDAFENTIATYSDVLADDIDIVLSPAPYVADKVAEHKEKTWNEFLRLIGIANMNFQKKERNIKDEVLASQGGTVASRYSRYEPRQKAVDEINEKFGSLVLADGSPVLENKIEVSYYDGLPTSQEELVSDVQEEGEVIDNDME